MRADERRIKLGRARIETLPLVAWKDIGLHRKRYSIDLPAHMAVCDANYLRLLKLLPRLAEEDTCRFGLAAADSDVLAEALVRVTVLERGPYTTLLEMTQLPEDQWGVYPSLTVRLYHDARSAEVVGYQKRRIHYPAVNTYPNPQMSQPDEKAQVNRLLGEYLAYCLHHGVDVAEEPLVTS